MESGGCVHFPIETSAKSPDQHCGERDTCPPGTQQASGALWGMPPAGACFPARRERDQSVLFVPFSEVQAALGLPGPERFDRIPSQDPLGLVLLLFGRVVFDNFSISVWILVSANFLVS